MMIMMLVLSLAAIAPAQAQSNNAGYLGGKAIDLIGIIHTNNTQRDIAKINADRDRDVNGTWAGAQVQINRDQTNAQIATAAIYADAMKHADEIRLQIEKVRECGNCGGQKIPPVRFSKVN